MTPEECNGEKDVMSLNRSVITMGRFWMMVTHDGVAITAQRTGEEATASISVPRATFRKFLDWYFKDQT